MLVAASHQLISETGGYRHGNIHTAAFAGTALADIHQLQVQDQGVHGLHHSGGQVGLRHTLDLVLALVGAEALRSAFAAEEHSPLAEHSQATDLDGTGSTYKGIGGNTVEIPHIHGIEAPIKGDRLHVDVRVQQFGGPGLDGLGPVNHLLGAAGGVNSQIFDAVLIGRYSVLYILNWRTAFALLPEIIGLSRLIGNSAPAVVGLGHAEVAGAHHPVGTI